MFCSSLRGLQHATMCKMHHSLPLPWCTENFQSGYHWLVKSVFYCLWGFRKISGNAWEIGDNHPSFLVDWISKITVFHFMGDARELVFSGSRADLYDLQLG